VCTRAQKDGGAVEMTVHDDRSLLALQGPAAAETLAPLVDVDLSKMYFANFAKLDIAGIPCYLTRTG
jgi:aminomethyltransferase